MTNIKIGHPCSAVITIPDPDETELAIVAELGGVMEWRTESQKYPNFEVHFIGGNPADDTPNFIGKGSIHHPLVLAANKLGNYKYTVKHLKEGCDPVTSPVRAAGIIPCRHC